ncbi:MAG TPA: (2Fe-2S)-binding protein [Puia sp.]|nr:(2Fe-2S)-binding protein [Puia sp.]
MATIELRVNGKKHSVQADPATPLLYVLRNQLALNGPKYGCGIQQCGACMVLLDGKATPSCMLPVEAIKNSAIVTLEGLAGPVGSGPTGAGSPLHPVQTAFVEEQAAQCGYCLNGMVLSAVSLLQENPHPDDAAIRAGMQRSLCRCGTQARIIRAVKRAAAGHRSK